MSIPCKYKNGAPVSVVEADMIMRALGFSSAAHAEDVIGAAERRRKDRKRKTKRQHAESMAQLKTIRTGFPPSAVRS